MVRGCLAIVIAALVLAGCVPLPSGSPTQPPPSDSPVPDPSTPPSSTPDSDVYAWLPSGRPVDSALYTNPDDGIVFSSPSGNITCGYTEYGREWWWCLLIEQTVTLPPDPAGECTGTYFDTGTPIVPNGLGVDGTDPDARPESFCGSASAAAVLEYGNSVTYRNVACDSTEDGMTCRSLVSGNGFRLSRSDYQLF